MQKRESDPEKSPAAPREAAASPAGDATLSANLNELLLHAERAARHRIEQLQALTATLSAARTSEEIARATLEVGSRVAAAARGSVCRVFDSEADRFELIGSIGYDEDTLQRWRHHSMRSTPAGDAVRSQQPVVVSRLSELLERYPAVRALIEREHISGTAVFPLLGLVPDDSRPGGAIRGFVSFDFDHEHELVESELQFLRALAQLCAQAIDRAQLYESLLEADRRRNEFLAMLGHELRNPLAPIANAILLLEKSPVHSEQRAAAIQIIKRQSTHLARLVDDLLEVSRVTQGRIELRKESVPAITAVHSAAEAVRPLIREQGQALDIDVPADAYVLADPARLTQIIANLLGNAAKYTQHGGHLAIRAHVVGAWLEIALTDNGAGIEPELLPRIFDLFSQGAATIDRSRGGLGLGLALVKQLIELHGGTIRAESPGLGRGAVFTLQLPLSSPGQGTPETTIGAVAVAVGSKSILVVDDNGDAALSLATLLESDGHEVRVAYDGVAAIEQARTFRPDVVLLDIGLPRMDGYAVARELRRDPNFAGTVVIAISGYGQTLDREKSKLAGFDAHLLKPAGLEEIYGAIGRK